MNSSLTRKRSLPCEMNVSRFESHEAMSLQTLSMPGKQPSQEIPARPEDDRTVQHALSAEVIPSR
jgi:hypothetical protein